MKLLKKDKPEGSHSTFTYSLDLKYPFKTAEGERNSVEGFGIQINYKDNIGHGISPPLSLSMNTEKVSTDFRAMLRNHLEFTIVGPVLKPNPFSGMHQFVNPVKLAALELKAKSNNKPLSHAIFPDLLPVTHIPVIGLLPQIPLESFVEELQSTLKVGHRSLKLKVGDLSDPNLGLEDDLARIKAIRDLVPDISLSLDANGAYNKENVLSVLNDFAEYNIEYIEEPVAGILEMAELCKTSPIKIAVDESCSKIQDLDEVDANTEINIFVIKPTRYEDLPNLFLKARKLQKEENKVVVSSAMDGKIGLAIAVHFASLLDAADTTPAGFDTEKVYVRKTGEPFEMLNDSICVPTKPGLGVEMHDLMLKA